MWLIFLKTKLTLYQLDKNDLQMLVYLVHKKLCKARLLLLFNQFKKKIIFHTILNSSMSDQGFYLQMWLGFKLAFSHA